MSTIRIIGLSMIAIALITIVSFAIFVTVRALALKARAQKLQYHPALLAAQSSQDLSEKMAGMPERIARIQSRLKVIAENIALLLATSALLRGGVAEIARSTEDLLDAFVPSMRGSL